MYFKSDYQMMEKIQLIHESLFISSYHHEYDAETEYHRSNLLGLVPILLYHIHLDIPIGVYDPISLIIVRHVIQCVARLLLMVITLIQPLPLTNHSLSIDIDLLGIILSRYVCCLIYLICLILNSFLLFFFFSILIQNSFINSSYLQTLINQTFQQFFWAHLLFFSVVQPQSLFIHFLIYLLYLFKLILNQMIIDILLLF